MDPWPSGLSSLAKQSGEAVGLGEAQPLQYVHEILRGHGVFTGT